jgi:hypothetical protein
MLEKLEHSVPASLSSLAKSAWADGGLCEVEHVDGVDDGTAGAAV